MSALSQRDIDEKLPGVGGWTQNGDEISKDWTFADFDGAMGFVNRVAEAARQMDHHPDIDIRYNKVRLVLSTHSEGGITDKDFELAGTINTLAR